MSLRPCQTWVLLSFTAVVLWLWKTMWLKSLTMKIHTIDRKVEGFSDSQRFAYVRYRPQAYLKRCQSLDSWTYVLKNYLRRRLQLQYGFNSQCKKVCYSFNCCGHKTFYNLVLKYFSIHLFRCDKCDQFIAFFNKVPTMLKPT